MYSSVVCDTTFVSAGGQQTNADVGSFYRQLCPKQINKEYTHRLSHFGGQRQAKALALLLRDQKELLPSVSKKANTAVEQTQKEEAT